jgi:hypothetical protein
MSQTRHRRGFGYAGGVCEQLAGFYEAWRCESTSNMELSMHGTDQLFQSLNQDVYATPRRGANGDFPTLTITPIEVCWALLEIAVYPSQCEHIVVYFSFGAVLEYAGNKALIQFFAAVPPYFGQIRRRKLVK